MRYRNRIFLGMILVGAISAGTVALGCLLLVGIGRSARTDSQPFHLAAIGVTTALCAAGVAAAVGWYISRRLAQPVETLAKAADEVAAGRLPKIARNEMTGEIHRISQCLDSILERLRKDEDLRERTRQQLTHSERLAAVGRLAAGVAHEINNPLTGVLTFAHLLLRDAPENSRERADIEMMIQATMRCKEIVRGLLDFARQNEPQKKLADLNAIIREAQRLTGNQASIQRVEVVMELDPALPPLVLDASQIQQVLVNMIVNALDAMPQGGRLTLRTRTTGEAGKRFVEVEISDTGCGIPHENLAHIFEPFFTTKPTGKGTGLGLSIAYGIISEHGGTISVRSEVGAGSTFTIRLPIAEEQRKGDSEQAHPGR